MIYGDDDEYHLLGLALIAAQRVEFVLYGIASHAAHMPAAQKEKRFRDLTPEEFLRGDAGELKATLGQLVEAFGDAFLIRTPDLIAFYKDRNLIAHDYVRLFRFKFAGASAREDGRGFLIDFIRRAVHWETVLRGLLAELIQCAAVKEGRGDEFSPTSGDLERVSAYREHAGKYLASKNTSQQG